jgi:hypothetical protein
MLRDLAKVREGVVAASSGAGGVNATMPPIPMLDASSTSPQTAGSRFGASAAGSAVHASEGFALPAGLTVGLIAIGLLVGGALGWSTRAPDLLSPSARPSKAAPALWLDPEWSSVPKKANAELQYRYAQILAPPGTRVASWLAVPGYFPQAHDWASKAYDQLSRRLFRDRDSARLRVFGAELAKMERVHERILAELVTVAADVLDGDPESAVALLNPQGVYFNKITDPAIAELALEVTLTAQRQARSSATGTVRAALERIETQLAQRTLMIMQRDIYGFAVNF